MKTVFCFVLILLANLSDACKVEEELEDLVKIIRNDVDMMQNTIKTTETELQETKDQLSKVEERLLKSLELHQSNVDTIEYLEREVSILRDPPYSFACGSHVERNQFISETITFTKLLYSSTNVEGAVLDISTGLFNAGHPGTYSASWALTASDDEGDHYVQLYLRKNKNIIPETFHDSYYYGRSYGSGPSGINDQGGRTVLVHLDRGDTLDLYCEDCSAEIFFLTFCVSLEQFDVV